MKRIFQQLLSSKPKAVLSTLISANSRKSIVNLSSTNCYKSVETSTPTRCINGVAGLSSVQTQSARYIMTQQMRAQTFLNIDEMFDSVYAQVLDEIVEDSHAQKSQLLGGDVKKWLQDSLDYNLKNGKRYRAKSLVIAYEHLAQSIEEDNIRKACLLGWCVELLQAYFLVVDDIMDASITRRGQLCWYRKENVGMIAINDAIMINNSIYWLLHKHFDGHPNYTKIVTLFNEITRFTAYGQCLDVLSNPCTTSTPSQSVTPPDLKTFSAERQSTIVQYKTSYYTFCLPVRLAMYHANITADDVHQQAEEILLRIGHLFQVQDDYLDCYGDPTVTGKIGTDIEDGKCSWLAIQALNLANNTQRTVLEQHYGLHDAESVARVKQIYTELALSDHFLAWETKQHDEIYGLVQSIDESKGLSKKIFNQILSMIYQRKK